jgi:CubicO group peptidase (beta-lactamase class C family)
MPDFGIRRAARLIAVVVGALLAAVASGGELAATRPEDVGLSSARLARLDAAMLAEVDAGRKAGIVVLIARHGKVAHEKAYGFADLESRTPMTTEHLFRLFSMTKPVTSVALLMLYEEGKFQLNDPLDTYIPAFKDVKVMTGVDASGKPTLEDPKRKPTIHDVFRHTAGFGYGFGQSPADRVYQENGIDFGKLGSLQELADKLATVPLLYHPGEQWVYSVAHDVQAYLVEHFSGMPFDRFCRERIFEPLGMRDAVFGVPKRYASRYTAEYGPAPSGGGLELLETRDGNPPRNAPPGPLGGYARYTTVPFGGLSLSSTAMDYAQFGQMLVNGGELDGVRILGRKTVELMTSNNLPPNIPGIGFAPGTGNPATGYGLGVSVLLNPALAENLGSKGNFGWAGAASTWAIMDPVEDMVLLLMTQYLPSDASFAGLFQTLAYQAIVE